METLDWDAEALDVAGITAERLSRLVPTTHVLTGHQARLCSTNGSPGTAPRRPSAPAMGC